MEPHTAGGSRRDVLAGNVAPAGVGLLQEEAAGPSNKSELGKRAGITAGPGNRTVYGGQDSADAEVLRGVQKRGRFAGDQRNRAEEAR